MLWNSIVKNSPKQSIKIKWQSQHDQKILFYVQLQSKLSLVQKILCINYDFKDLISKQIISQFQLL
jgi:hypothetical protein